MSIAIMMGGASHKEFWDRVHRGPPPMSENERRAMAAQIYPALLPMTPERKAELLANLDKRIIEGNPG